MSDHRLPTLREQLIAAGLTVFAVALTLSSLGFALTHELHRPAPTLLWIVFMAAGMILGLAASMASGLSKAPLIIAGAFVMPIVVRALVWVPAFIHFQFLS